MTDPIEAETVGLVSIPLGLSSRDASNEDIAAPKIIKIKNQRFPNSMNAKTMGIAIVALRNLTNICHWKSYSFLS